MDIKIEPKEEELVDAPDLINPEIDILEPTPDCEDIKPLKLKCPSCSDTFNCEYLLKVHEMLHDPKHYCTFCKRTIQRDFKVHVMGKHFNQCEQCLKTFTSTRALKSHMEIHSGDLSYIKCEHCDKLFRQRGSLLVHFRATHQGMKPFSCKICVNVNFTTSSGMKKHMRAFHGPNGPTPRKAPEHHFKCNVCSEFVNTKNEKTLHEMEHEATKSCKICYTTFDTTLDLTRHYTQLHVPPDLLVCYICWITFKNYNRLKYHIGRVHKGMKKSCCQDCDMIFTSETELGKHNRRYHNTNKPHDLTQCTICDFSCLVSSKVKDHALEIHGEEGCYKTIKHESSTSMNAHKLCPNSNEDPLDNLTLTCNDCGKQFTDEKKLTGHTCVSRPVYCHLCKRKLTKSIYWKRHMISNHSPNVLEDKKTQLENNSSENTALSSLERKFKCEKCLLGFDKTQDFKKHMCGNRENSVNESEGNIKPQKIRTRRECIFCGFMCMERRTLKKHMLKFHTVTDNTGQHQVQDLSLDNVSHFLDKNNEPGDTLILDETNIKMEVDSN